MSDHKSQIARLEDERSTLVAQLTDLTETGADGAEAGWNAAKQARYESMYSHVDTIDERIASLTAMDKEMARHMPPVVAADAEQEAKERAFSKFLRKGDDGMDGDEKSAFLSPDGSFVLLTNPTTASHPTGVSGLETGTDPVFTLEQSEGITTVAGSFTSEKGTPFNWPTIDSAADTTPSSSAFSIPHATDRTEFPGVESTDVKNAPTAYATTHVQFPQVPEIFSKEFPVRTTFLEDAEVPMESIITQQCVRRLGYKINQDSTLGADTDQMRGFAANTSVGATISKAGPIDLSFEALNELRHAPDLRSYRMGESYMGGRNAMDGMYAWAGSDLCLRQIRGLVDGNMRPLMLPHDEGIVPGFGAIVLGIPFVVCDWLTDPATIEGWATDANVLWLGNWGYYKFRMHSGVEVRRYEDSNVAPKGFVIFDAKMRIDGRFIGGGTIVSNQVTASKAIQHLAVDVA